MASPPVFYAEKQVEDTSLYGEHVQWWVCYMSSRLRAAVQHARSKPIHPEFLSYLQSEVVSAVIYFPKSVNKGLKGVGNHHLCPRRSLRLHPVHPSESQENYLRHYRPRYLDRRYHQLAGARHRLPRQHLARIPRTMVAWIRGKRTCSASPRKPPRVSSGVYGRSVEIRRNTPADQPGWIYHRTFKRTFHRTSKYCSHQGKCLCLSDGTDSGSFRTRIPTANAARGYTRSPALSSHESIKCDQ